jgi:hypothetical protein
MGMHGIAGVRIRWLPANSNAGKSSDTAVSYKYYRRARHGKGWCICDAAAGGAAAGCI